MPLPVIAIFDIGKTNKKVCLFDEEYNLLFEQAKVLPEIQDEDGFPCEDVTALTNWTIQSYTALLKDEKYRIIAINVSAYGASLVYLNALGEVMLPLYNYLKPYPPSLLQKFYNDYGDEKDISKQTASPALGHLNSGLQLYRLKYEKPDAFAKIKWALHLPQYIAYLLTNKIGTDITSIGCHTFTWDFARNAYHTWVEREGIASRFPPLLSSRGIAGHTKDGIPVGVGLHDSSAALIPYLSSFPDPFVLLSTGTWCISLNPFNHSPLTETELENDCLCYLSHEGKSVKAARIFAGNEHEQQTKRLADHFNKPLDHFASLSVNEELIGRLKPTIPKHHPGQSKKTVSTSAFAEQSLNGFQSYEEAYHQLLIDILQQQVASTNQVLAGTSVSRIFVDGGFSKNPIFMKLLTGAYPTLEVYSSSMHQASALGATMAIINKPRDKYKPYIYTKELNRIKA